MSARVLLIDAVSRWTSREEDERYEQVVLPLGLMYLSAYLKSEVDPGVETRILNALIDLPRREDIGGVIREFKPQVVGVRGLTLFEDLFNQLCAAVKEIDPSILVVGGGPLPTTEPDRVASNPNVDICVVGEGELTFAEILRSFSDGRPLTGIAGTVARDAHGALVSGAERPLIADLDALPLPDYDAITLADYQAHLNYGYNRRRQGVLLTSRGCPYRCIFCHVNLGKKFRERSPQKLLEEVEILYRRHGIEDIFIVDDIFNLDYDRATAFLDLVIQNGLKLRFYLVNGIRGDLVDQRFIDKMRDAGVIWVSYAIESGDAEMQKLIRKHLNFEKTQTAIRQSVERGLIVNYSFILGFPTETLEQAWSTMHLVGSLPSSVLPFCFDAKYYPGTEMFEMAVKLGHDEDALRLGTARPYHGVGERTASAMTADDLSQLHQHYLRKLFMPGIRQSIKNLSQHYSQDEVVELYRALFHRPFKSIAEILELCPERREAAVA